MSRIFINHNFECEMRKDRQLAIKGKIPVFSIHLLKFDNEKLVQEWFDAIQQK